MPGSGAQFSVSARSDPARGWLVIRVEVGGPFTFLAALTAFPRSRVSQDLIDFAAAIGLVDRMPNGTYTLRQLTVAGAAVA